MNGWGVLGDVEKRDGLVAGVGCFECQTQSRMPGGYSHSRKHYNKAIVVRSWLPVELARSPLGSPAH